MLGFDFDTVAAKEAESVFSKAFVEHWEDFWGDVIDCYVEVWDERRVKLLEILLAEIEEFSSEFDTGGWNTLEMLNSFRELLTASSNNGEVEELVSQLRRCRWQ